MATGPWGGAGNRSIFDVKVQFNLATSRCQFGFTVRDVEGGTPTAQAVIDAVHPWVTTHIKPMLYPVDAVVGVDVVNPATKIGSSYTFANGAGTIGQVAAARVPSLLAVVVSMKGEMRTRYGQGRFFLPVRDEAFIEGETLSGTAVTAYNAALASLEGLFIGDTATTGFRLVNAHKLLPGDRPHTAGEPLPEVPATWYDVVSLRLNTTITALRSRRAGVGT